MTLDRDLLQHHSLFGGLTDGEMEYVSAHFHEKHYAARETIASEGQTGDCVYFIRSGAVRVLKRAGDPARPSSETLATLGPGDSFGEMEFIDVQPFAATVEATQDTTVLTLTNRDLYHISKWNMKTFAVLVLNMAREISRRLRQTNALAATCLYATRSLTDDPADRSRPAR